MKAAGSVEFDRLLVLFNPASTNAAKAKERIAALQQSYPGKVLVETCKPGGATVRTLLRRHLRPGDILISSGGDGTQHAVISDLILDPTLPEYLRSTPVLPLGAGRMNDLAHMLYGKHFDDPEHALQYGRKLAVYPLLCTITPLDTSAGAQTEQHLAVYELGFGFGSHISEASDDPELRAKAKEQSLLGLQLMYASETSRVLRETPFFDITYKGERQTVFDVTAASGHIIAGFLRLPARLSRREFLFVASHDKSPAAMRRLMGSIVTKKFSRGEMVTSATFTLHQPALAHMGGKPFIPPTPCTVHIEPYEKPVTMLATSPKA